MSEPGVAIDSQRLHLVGHDEALRSLTSAMVLSMPRERQAVFALAIAERLSYREIAQRLGIDESATKFHLRDGLATMHQEVAAQLAVLGGPRSAGTTGRTIDHRQTVVAVP